MADARTGRGARAGAAGGTVKVATWNVNSLRVRLPQVLAWLDEHEPDLLALQEIKQPDAAVDADAIRDAGYHIAVNGQKTYNGVALISRAEPRDLVRDLPGFDDAERRVIAATLGQVRCVNVYVPNGQSVGSDKYEYKLRWFDALARYLAAERRRYDQVIVLGDFNVAPADADVHDPEKWRGGVLVSEAERSRLAGIIDSGFADTFRLFEQPAGIYSWWDYRARCFQRNHGLRIDLVLASPAMAERCRAASVDRSPREAERPSDHAPAIAEFDGAVHDAGR